jgi:adenylylsulfate kinase-like enzyme
VASQTRRVVIVITGPIASGKSALAREVGGVLERRDIRAAVIDLDVIHRTQIDAGSISDDAAWVLARRQAAELANTVSDEGATVVIAEGSFNQPSHRAAFTEHLRDSDTIYVTLNVSLQEALRRAQGDPTRGRSRDPDFLAGYFARHEEVRATIPSTDLVIDTEQTTLAAAAAAVADLVTSGGR